MTTQEKISGDPAGNESADPSRAEYAESVERISNVLTATLIAYTYHRTKREIYYAAKAGALHILQICQRFEEGKRSSQTTHGGPAQNEAEKVSDPYLYNDLEPLRPSRKQLNPSVAKASRQSGHHKLQMIGSHGLQLCFELYCFECGFQCWDCPICLQMRCGCISCSCALEETKTRPEDDGPHDDYR